MTGAPTRSTNRAAASPSRAIVRRRSGSFQSPQPRHVRCSRRPSGQAPAGIRHSRPREAEQHPAAAPSVGPTSVDWRRSCPQRWTITDVRGEGMGDIVFRGREPFDLIAQRLPSAIAENKIVVATLPIFASGFPGNSTEIRLLLAPHQAEDLARQLLLEAKKARENPL